MKTKDEVIHNEHPAANQKPVLFRWPWYVGEVLSLSWLLIRIHIAQPCRVVLASPAAGEFVSAARSSH